MYWSRQRLKEMARVALRGSYWKCVLVALILAVAAGAGVNQTTRLEIRGEGGHVAYSIYRIPAPLLLFAIGAAIVGGAMWIAFHFLVLEPAEVSCCAFFNSDLYAPAELGEMKKGFLPNYWNVVKVQLFRTLYTFLWSLLFVIPGIIKSYEYRMIPYILAEDPNIDRAEAFARSKAMMDGEKWNAFILDLSFIGWFLLSGVTCGILGLFYVNPYYYLTNAALYGALKRKMTILESGGNGTAGGSAAGGAYGAGTGSPVGNAAGGAYGAGAAPDTGSAAGNAAGGSAFDAGSAAGDDATGSGAGATAGGVFGAGSETPYSQDATDFTGTAGSESGAAHGTGSWASDGQNGSTSSASAANAQESVSKEEEHGDDVLDATWEASEPESALGAESSTFEAGAASEVTAGGATADTTAAAGPGVAAAGTTAAAGAGDAADTTTAAGAGDAADTTVAAGAGAAAGTEAATDAESTVDMEAADESRAVEEASPFEAEPVLKPETPEAVKVEGPVDAPWVIYAQSQSAPGLETTNSEPESENYLTPESDSVPAPEKKDENPGTDGHNSGSPFEI